MKKNITRALALVLTATLLFAASACAINVTVSYDPKTLDSLESMVDKQAAQPAATQPAPTQAPTAAPTEAPTAAPSEAPTQPTSADPAAPTDAPTDAPTEAPTAAPSGSIPTGTDAIADFYKQAVARVKDNGEAGYIKKEWQTISDLNITGNGTIDGKISDIVGGYMTTEDECEPQDSPKGDDSAKNRFAPFTLTDYTKIASATCTQNANGNYDVYIVMCDEDTPKKEGSFLGQATSSILYWEDIAAEISANVKILTEYEGNCHVIYKGYEIKAEITPDGKFVSMDQTAHVDIQVGHAKILFFSLDDKSAHLENYVTFRDFVY